MAFQGVADDRQDRRVHFLHRDLGFGRKVVLYLIDLRLDALLAEIDVGIPVHKGRDLAATPAGGAAYELQVGYLFYRVLERLCDGDHHLADRLLTRISYHLYLWEGDLREQRGLHVIVYEKA